MLMFALFPILGITQGFIPIAGYNHGAQNYERVKESIQISIKYAALLASLIFVLYFTMHIVSVLLPIKSYCRDTGCLALVFAASLLCHQLIGLPIQAAGNAKKSVV
jgi:Na+-driven multidrug efflux pump